MKTSIKKYKRGTKEITLIGCCHIGEISYYDRISKELSSMQDKDIFYEGVQFNGNHKDQNIGKFMKLIADTLDLTYQKKGIVYKKDSWTRSDLDYDLIRTIRGKNILSSGEIDEYDLTDKDFINAIKKLRPLILLIISIVLWFRRVFPKKDEGLLEFRNYKVMTDAFTHLIDNDSVCILYGEGHLVGIEKSLRSLGFNKTKTVKLNPFKK